MTKAGDRASEKDDDRPRPKAEPGSPQEWTHIDSEGALRMVDVGSKPPTERRAIAEGFIRLDRKTLAVIRGGSVAKGNVLEAARLAGLQAAKRTSELIPLCHALPLDAVRLDFALLEDLPPPHGRLRCEAEVRLVAKTGAEMEALTAVSVALLTVYDMVKAVDRGAILGPIRLLEKHGGQRGSYRAEK